MVLQFVQVLCKTPDRDQAAMMRAEMAANVSLGWPRALVGAKHTTSLTETFAAVPQKRPRTSEKGALVKPHRIASGSAARIISYPPLQTKTWARATTDWT